MYPNFADDLLGAIEEKGAPVCVGIDPVYEKLPKEFQEEFADEVERTTPIGDFCYALLDIIAPFVPAVKIQSGFFERYGAVGVDLYEHLVRAAQDLDLVVIGDVKRGDIGSTAEAYALGHMTGLFSPFGPSAGHPDAITVNPLFGTDGLQPFLDIAAQTDRGIFILVRTSNPSAKEIQDIPDAAGRPVFEHIAEMVARLGAAEDLVGDRGYSCVGAVVGATYPDEARRLRQLMPQQIFLVPGYGAQGATAGDCAAAFKDDGTGAIVNASRSVLYPWTMEKYAKLEWKDAIRAAVKDFAGDIRSAVGR